MLRDLQLGTRFPRTHPTWCPYNWTYPYSDGESDCSDGTKNKPYKDTTVHEFGHFFGLGHQSIVDFPTSAMNTDGCSPCSYDTISEPDITALQELYNQCQ